MKKRLKDAIFGLASSRITHPATKETTQHLNALLYEIFSVKNTPDHPPYPEMISEAIEALKEEGGSSEASISSYIKLHCPYDDLPMGHESLLSHHLSQLSAKGEKIVKDSNGCHMIASISTRNRKKQKSQVNNNDDDDDDQGEVKEVIKKRRGRPPKQEEKRPATQINLIKL